MATAKTLFEKIADKEIPSKLIYEDDIAIAFNDIAPQAPVHFLVVPRKCDGLTGVSKSEERHQAVLGHLLLTAAKVAKAQGLEKGYRLVINEGEHGGQAVPHLHIHVLGGAQLSWPPGAPGPLAAADAAKH